MRATFGSALLFVAVAATVYGAEAESPGAAMYVRYCGACHGPKGQGDGVAATVLRPKPSNLTTIAHRHGGEFPAATIAAFIDGTKPLAAHGSADMPVWGELLREEAGGTGTKAVNEGRVMLITEYLRSIQKR